MPENRTIASDIVVSAVGLTKIFGEHVALDAVSLDVAAGRVTALIGENGSGKSTMIKCLTGVYTPDGRGQLVWGTAAGAGACVAVHQDLGLVPGLTIAENFGLAIGFEQGLFGRVKWRAHNRRVAQELQVVGLAVAPQTRIDDLNVAEKSLVAIARTLAGSSEEVRLIILDEPTAALPSAERELVLATVRRLTAEGFAVLYVSHHLDEVAEIADRVVVLRNGAKVHDVENDDFDSNDLLELMTGVVTPPSSAKTTVEGDVLVSVRGLRTRLLEALDFDVRRGEVLGFHGELDSGSSDVCRALAGALEYDGEVAVDGAVLAPHDIGDSVRKGVYIVPGDRKREGIFAALSVRDNLNLARMRRQFLLSPLKHRAMAEFVGTVMDSLDIRPRDPARLVGQLSGGNQQKVVLARALSQDPRLLILENPTQGVDPAARLHIRERIRQAASEGISVIVTDVDEKEVIAVADRVLRLEKGRISA